jgi:succinyl-diaminopimelate desuccinylase
MSATLRLAEQLISCESVTPRDAGCQPILAARLQALGFECETIVSGPADFRVTNLWALRAGSMLGSQAGPDHALAKTLVFAGHTDVVPTGPLDQWHSPPFVPTHREGKLYGRGASDMKTSLAAMVVAVEEFLTRCPAPAHSIGFLLTSDEEGPALDGTVVVCEWLEQRGQKIDYCVVGEPTSVERCGDMIKNGRRGSLSGKLTVKGVQGHIAYPHLAKNPIHRVAPVLAELVAHEWDPGNAFFPPTTWQISNIHGGTGAGNVIPGTVVIDFNFRYSTQSTAHTLKKRLHEMLDRHGLDYSLEWTLGGLPFLTEPGELVNAMVEAIRAETGLTTQLSTTGGTSDGRFISRICPQLIEFGPPNATIHMIDEHVALQDIEPLKNIYRGVLERLLA